MDKSEEMAHGLDINMNESFNNICTWFAPKNKVFAGSGSLHNRIAFTVGVNSCGVLLFYKKLFRKMGITVTDNVEHYLEHKESNRIKKLAKVKTSTAKKDKNKRKYENLKAHTIIAKKEHHKREGTYRKGMNMDDPYGELLNGQEDQEAGKKQPASKRAKKAVGYCQYCGKSDHLTKRSKNCKAGLDARIKFHRDDGSLLSGPPVQEPAIADHDLALLLAAAAAPELESLLEAAAAPPVDDEAEAADCSCFDSLPFYTILNSDDEASKTPTFDFHDTQTWDTDDEESQQGDVSHLI
jgi:hypothetical protein